MTDQKSPFRYLGEIVESLNTANGAATQLIHQCGNPIEFIIIRETIQLMREGVMKLAKENRIIA
jgi:hypothetical protein